MQLESLDSFFVGLMSWGSRGPAACSQDGIPGGAGCNQWQLESGEEIRVNDILEWIGRIIIAKRKAGQSRRGGRLRIFGGNAMMVRSIKAKVGLFIRNDAFCFVHFP